MKRFYEWLCDQRERPDRIADLANDVQYDPSWPVDATSLAELRAYFKTRGITDGPVYDTLTEAWAAYRRWRNNEARHAQP